MRDRPFASARRFFATAYARSKLGRQREPLAQAMAEGVVSGVIARFPGGITEEKLIKSVSEELTIDEESTRTLVAQSLSHLTRDGICTVHSNDDLIYFESSGEPGTSYDAAVGRLVEGVVNRYRLQEGGRDSVDVRCYLNAIFGELLLQRGWELGASYAGRQMPTEVDLELVMNRVDGGNIRPAEISRIERALKDLLMRPDDEEVALLADLGRTAFGLELLLEAPHDTVFLKRALPDILYFDANVILPAITLGHPLHDLFHETIRALREASGDVSVGPSLRVYDGFLNEIISHKKLAVGLMEANNGEGAMWERSLQRYLERPM